MVSKGPAKGFHRLSVDVRIPLFERLKALAKRRRWPMRILVEEALSGYLDEQEQTDRRER